MRIDFSDIQFMLMLQDVPLRASVLFVLAEVAVQLSANSSLVNEDKARFTNALIDSIILSELSSKSEALESLALLLECAIPASYSERDEILITILNLVRINKKVTSAAFIHATSPQQINNLIHSESLNKVDAHRQKTVDSLRVQEIQASLDFSQDLIDRSKQVTQPESVLKILNNLEELIENQKSGDRESLLVVVNKDRVGALNNELDAAINESQTNGIDNRNGINSSSVTKIEDEIASILDSLDKC